MAFSKLEVTQKVSNKPSPFLRIGANVQRVGWQQFCRRNVVNFHVTWAVSRIRLWMWQVDDFTQLFIRWTWQINRPRTKHKAQSTKPSKERQNGPVIMICSLAYHYDYSNIETYSGPGLAFRHKLPWQAITNNTRHMQETIFTMKKCNKSERNNMKLIWFPFFPSQTRFPQCSPLCAH